MLPPMKAVAYESPFVPVEWIAAHGLRPYWTRLGWSDGGPVAGAIQGVCPYARAFVDGVLSDTHVAAIVMTTTCDQMRHAAALVAGSDRRPLFLMNVPSTWETDAAVGLYLEELKRLGRFLVQIGGESPSAERLIQVMAAYECSRRAVRAARDRLSARQFAEAVASLHTDAQAAADTQQGASAKDGIPLALVGGPLLAADCCILDLIERAGGRLVLDATDGGERTLPAEFDRQNTRADPLKGLADAYFGSIPDVFRRPNDGLYEWLAREMAARKVRGVILRRYVWCDLWHAELHRLRQWSPVPVLDIDVCHDDDSLPGRTAGRIEAFLEMLRGLGGGQSHFPCGKIGTVPDVLR